MPLPREGALTVTSGYRFAFRAFSFSSLCFSSFSFPRLAECKKWLRLLSGQTTLVEHVLQGSVMSQALPLITRQGDRIAIVSGLRTPFARQATAFHGIPAVDLGKMVVGEMLARSEIPPEVIEQLVFGQVVQMPEAPNIAREIVLGTGMNVHTDAYSVSRACATSFQAVANVAESLMAGTIRAGLPAVPTPLPYCPSASVKSWPAFWWMSIKPVLPGSDSNSSRACVYAT
jgi:hypothetical protein